MKMFSLYYIKKPLRSLAIPILSYDHKRTNLGKNKNRSSKFVRKRCKAVKTII